MVALLLCSHRQDLQVVQMAMCLLCSQKANVVQAALRDKLLQDHSVLAAFLTGLRMYLEDPTKVTKLTSASTSTSLLLMLKFSSSQ